MKISINGIDNYKNNGGANFFKLEDDKDTAKVRFMYNTLDDVELDVVHEVEFNGKKRYVNCIRSYDEPIDNCPMCKCGNKPSVKLFVPVYVENAGEVQFWQRGKSFISQLSGLCNRYNPLVSTEIEIERNGKKGDQGTRYQLYPGKTDESVTIDSLPEVPNTLDSFILDKTYEELANYVETGSFDEAKSEIIPRRTPSNRTRPAF